MTCPTGLFAWSTLLPTHTHSVHLSHSVQVASHAKVPESSLATQRRAALAISAMVPPSSTLDEVLSTPLSANWPTQQHELFLYDACEFVPVWL